jgi:hypothetical protein
VSNIQSLTITEDDSRIGVLGVAHFAQYLSLIRVMSHENEAKAKISNSQFIFENEQWVLVISFGHNNNRNINRDEGTQTRPLSLWIRGGINALKAVKQVLTCEQSSQSIHSLSLSLFLSCSCIRYDCIELHKTFLRNFVLQTIRVAHYSYTSLSNAFRFLRGMFSPFYMTTRSSNSITDQKFQIFLIYAEKFNKLRI